VLALDGQWNHRGSLEPNPHDRATPETSDSRGNPSQSERKLTTSFIVWVPLTSTTHALLVAVAPINQSQFRSLQTRNRKREHEPSALKL
jgi:hypothetical protein